MRRTHLFAWCLLSAAALGQESFPHTELRWSTITTEHFLVHFHDGGDRAGREVSRIAESVYGPITTLYGYAPKGRVSIVLRGYDDYSNGAAYFYDNKIDIWLPSLDFELRGEHPWLLNVITHEFTHIVQMQTSMKWTRRVPAIYFQWLGYESERRPDVLYGYPNVLVSYPISGFVVPSWFAEGTAQYNHPDLTYDRWDTHRDMILRMYVLEGKPLTWEEMAVFGKTSLGNESSYNAGFSIVSYIASRFGDSAVVRVSRELSRLPRVTIDGAVEDALGITGQRLYDDWLADKRRAYEAVRDSVASRRTEGALITPDGFGNLQPTFGADPNIVYFVSNAGEDYFGLSSLRAFDRRTGTTNDLTARVRSRVAVSPDGRSLTFARIGRDNPHWSSVSDLYRYDLATDVEHRLTHGLRAQSPALSPDGKRLAFVTGAASTLNLAVADADGGNMKLLTQFTDGEQVYTPSWSKDGATIAFAFANGHDRTLAFIDTAGTGLRFSGLPGDSRDPAYAPDGNWLYFSWDEGGRFNIHRMSLQSGWTEQVTEVLGGAFQPSVDSSGTVAFARYDATGYKIALLPPRTIESPRLMFRAAVNASSAVPQRAALPDASAGTPAESLTVTPYRSVFSSLSLFPLLRVDNYNPRNKGIDIIKPGLYFVSSEVLDKVGLFGGAAINRRLERDLFLVFEYRDKLPLVSMTGLEPTASLELYNISRVTNTSFNVFTDREHDIPVDVTYNLLEFDASLRQAVLTENTLLKLAYTYSKYSADLGAFILPGVGLSPAFRNTYLLGNAVWLQMTTRAIHPTVDEAINPVGRAMMFRYTHEFNKYNRDLDYDIVNGLLVPLYRRYRFDRWEGQWNEYLRMPWDRQTLTLSLRAGAITGGEADTIFHFYGGGMVGLKGYPFYSIEGTRVLHAHAAYRVPLAVNLNARLFQFTFTKLYASVFAEAGDAWTGGWSNASWKRDVGLELRLEAFSFYAYPTRFSFAGAYGLDKFTRRVENVELSYGHEWRFYFSVLFDFDITEPWGARWVERSGTR